MDSDKPAAFLPRALSAGDRPKDDESAAQARGQSPKRRAKEGFEGSAESAGKVLSVQYKTADERLRA
ncbi:hypothetical protein A7K93_11170 [Candidatus Methylacidiphilum fumarolicum]|uniref:Uncharacterized protein n=2 Tax=Candidatus Methylacidiphilum fumarolicum TaxID=591154 RepID=I0JY21_METFB|nr:hypothetical protein A7K73_08100 [Candidatus Methylacidiphilum fumarolicum]CCG92140.1 hypothetical protein MFUM_370002 [Methylacidiphilum fumariolicum SolV]TFE71220.1 hypothetical protein A7K93_11170 [Candidatus Methylacidiphilum fumarolicum]TFE72013.1 hypothetical protein A7K72_09545 [Candidatus Methylacidiphilum fumarolicum]TFE77374.1 hypothetical protein A7D33_05190 [Candidatus Methylacidiphilum fumarolicum]